MKFMRKRKICYVFNFVNLKYLIHETVLTFFIGLLSHDESKTHLFISLFSVYI